MLKTIISNQGSDIINTCLISEIYYKRDAIGRDIVYLELITNKKVTMPNTCLIKAVNFLNSNEPIFCCAFDTPEQEKRQKELDKRIQ